MLSQILCASQRSPLPKNRTGRGNVQLASVSNYLGKQKGDVDSAITPLPHILSPPPFYCKEQWKAILGEGKRPWVNKLKRVKS